MPLVCSDMGGGEGTDQAMVLVVSEIVLFVGTYAIPEGGLDAFYAQAGP